MLADNICCDQKMSTTQLFCYEYLYEEGKVTNEGIKRNRFDVRTQIEKIPGVVAQQLIEWESITKKKPTPVA